MDGNKRDSEGEGHSTILPCTCRELNACFFSPFTPVTQLDPGPTATIGGMLSTGCSGSQSSAIVTGPPPT
jgi:hypothetical protein